jgi:hypothetical protein
MNGAALNAFMSLFDNSDKKRKEDEQKRFERDRAAAKEDEQSRFERGIQKDINDENHAGNVALEKEQKVKANRPTIAGSNGEVGPFQNRWNIPAGADAKTATEYGLKNDEYRKALMTVNSSPIIQTLRDAGIPTDQILEMTGGSVDPAAIRAALGNLDAITKGVNPAQNSAAVAASKDAEGRSAIGTIENNKRLSNPTMIEDLVTTGDNLKRATNTLGGMEPWRMPFQEEVLVMNPDGTATRVKNPSVIGKGGGGFDGTGMLTGDPLEMGAAQLGFEKAPIEYDANFRPIKRVNSIPVPTPVVTKSLFSGNLKTDSGVEDFGKATYKEALGFRGLQQMPDGTIQAAPINLQTSFGNDNPFGITRQPTEEEKLALKRKALQVYKAYNK